MKKKKKNLNPCPFISKTITTRYGSKNVCVHNTTIMIKTQRNNNVEYISELFFVQLINDKNILDI